MYDYVVIGAGIIGTSVARELTRYQAKILVLERENDVANVQTLANSAILHSGHNPMPGSLKARLNVWGNQLYEELEKELQIPILRTGAYVVAHNASEEKQLEELFETATKNKVPEFAILNFEEAVKTEPNLSRTITKVLSLPTTKVTYPWEVAFACMENAIKNGAQLRKNAEVTALEYRDDHFVITINNQETIDSKYVINATGVDTDDIAILIEKSTPVNILPRKGEYFVLDKRVQGFVNHVLYPLPTEAGKGVLLTPQVHGNILVGPNSISVDDKRRTNTTYEGLEYVRKHADALAENIPYNKIIRSFAGIRASSDYDDFYIQESKKFKGLYHLAGIDSPGLTAAPAIAKYLVNEVINVSKEYQVNESFNPYRHKNPEFSTLPMEEQHDLIKQFPTYGNIICKCEKITEKEIVDAMKGPMGSDTIKGIKKRTRAGAGLCQGGYCEEKIMKLIAREKGISPLDVRYDGVNSNLFTSETKVKK